MALGWGCLAAAKVSGQLIPSFPVLLGQEFIVDFGSPPPPGGCCLWVETHSSLRKIKGSVSTVILAAHSLVAHLSLTERHPVATLYTSARVPSKLPSPLSPPSLPVITDVK